MRACVVIDMMGLQVIHRVACEAKMCEFKSVDFVLSSNALNFKYVDIPFHATNAVNNLFSYKIVVPEESWTIYKNV